jgi:hypothetical protein
MESAYLGQRVLKAMNLAADRSPGIPAAGTEYKIEVLAIENSGNQTIDELEFEALRRPVRGGTR